jgi:hypothetical protein
LEENRRTELSRKIVSTATTNDQHAVGTGGATRWEQVQQLAHASMLDRSMRVGNRLSNPLWAQRVHQNAQTTSLANSEIAYSHKDQGQCRPQVHPAAQSGWHRIC